MSFSDLPPSAAWRHQDGRSGFEVVFTQRDDNGCLLTGCTTAVEDDQAWIVEYRIRVDGAWRTRSARLRGSASSGKHAVALETDGTGHWRVDGLPAPNLDGCLDVDLESSALTNALPVHRLGLEVGGRALASAAYVRADGLRVERLEQDYTRISDDGQHQRYDYTAPAFDFSCELVYDHAGVVLSYPGIAVRVA